MNYAESSTGGTAPPASFAVIISPQEAVHPAAAKVSGPRLYLVQPAVMRDIAGRLTAAWDSIRTQTRDVQAADVRDITADLLATLARVRLVGRPCVVASADVLRALLQELVERLPTPDNRQFYLRLLFKSKKPDPSNVAAAFADCLTALGEANRQFTSALRSDHSTRRHTWQVWRYRKCHIRSAKELLDEAGQRSKTAMVLTIVPSHLIRSYRQAQPD